MIVDANDLDSGAELRSEVCIVGAGPVGISLALELARLGVDSLVLEAGGLERDLAVEELYGGDGGRLGDLATARVQALGGTTHHWGGQSRPLEAIDFESQPWHRGDGWPIPRDEGLARLDDAIDFLGLDHSGWDPSSWFPESTLVGDGTIVEKIFQARPLRVGEQYATALERSPRVTVVLRANVVQVRVDPVASTVTELEIKTLDGRPSTAVAQRYVVAAGGIESARLLLASTRDLPGGVGNHRGVVGRYFADHHATPVLPLVPGPAARLLPTGADIVLVQDLEARGIDVLRALALSDDGQRRLELAGFHAFLLGIDAAAPDPFELGVEALVNMSAPSPGEVRSVVIGFEQVPNPESRVTLADQTNDLGEPLAAVDWVLTDVDAEHVQRAVDLVAEFLARRGIGRLATRPPEGSWLDVVVSQYHHMGTLRMGADPSTSVVDADLRFHDHPNLYAAGTAVFPAYGHVNPTLNAVALTYRLADHLAQEVQP